MNIGEAWTVLTHNDGVILYSGKARFERASDNKIRCHDPRCTEPWDIPHSQFLREYGSRLFTTEPDEPA